ncbi:MAG: hypothetical protein Q7Q71_09890 [Verrucomicrobiota bacterium JB023]|nr:hypothetical protein [Verrucomicrobiota bacterium JB023]
MSDVIKAWVDEGEVKRLAEALLSRPILGEVEVKYGDNFEGFAEGIPSQEAAPVNEIRAREAASVLRKAREEAMHGGSVRPGQQAPASPFRRVTPTPAETSKGAGITPAAELKRPGAPNGNEPLLKRMQTFGEWLKGPVGAQSYFISTRNGQPLLDEVKNPKLVQVARTLAKASRPSRSKTEEMGSLHVRIGEHSILEVIPAPSQYGILILGLVVEHSLEDTVIREIRLGLQEVADARLIRP